MANYPTHDAPRTFEARQAWAALSPEERERATHYVNAYCDLPTRHTTPPRPACPLVAMVLCGGLGLLVGFTITALTIITLA